MIIVLTSKEQEERADLQFDLIEASTRFENLQKKEDRTPEETEEMAMLTKRIKALRKDLGIEGEPVDPPIMVEESEVAVDPEDAAAAQRAAVRQLKGRAWAAGTNLSTLLN